MKKKKKKLSTLQKNSYSNSLIQKNCYGRLPKTLRDVAYDSQQEKNYLHTFSFTRNVIYYNICR